MKSFFVLVGGLLAATTTTASVIVGYALAVALVSFALGFPVMVGFAIASSSSDGFIPAFGYVTSSAIIYVATLTFGSVPSGLAKQNND